MSFEHLGSGDQQHGVAGNPVVFACPPSFQWGFDGFVAFDARTKLIPHQEKTLGAVYFRGQRMVIPTDAAQISIDKYFKSKRTMGHIKEPKGIDFIIESKPLTEEAKAAISGYIRNYKTKHKAKGSRKTTTKTGNDKTSG